VEVLFHGSRDTWKKATAFEQNPTAAANLEKNAVTNGFDHVSIIVGTGGEDVTLAEFEPPDVVLMDIEGCKESVLQAADRLWTHPTLIIEMHEPSMLGTNAPENNPTTVIEYLKEKGYSVSMLGERSDENYHVLAVPTN
jgi:precorrin-6B methylase 2